MGDPDLIRCLAAIKPKGRDVLRRAMRAEQFERDELAHRLLNEPSQAAHVLAELIDLASLRPSIRQQLSRLLGQLEALDS